LQVDGRDAEHVTLDTLHSMLKGPLHSTVLLSLARADTGEPYVVEALRHGKHSFDGPNGSRAASPLPMSDLLKEAISVRSASIYSTSLYGSQRSDRSANDLYRSQDRRTAYDLYSSHRSAGSGRATPDSAGFPGRNEPRVLTPRREEEDGVVSSMRAPTMRFA